MVRAGRVTQYPSQLRVLWSVDLQAVQVCPSPLVRHMSVSLVQPLCQGAPDLLLLWLFLIFRSQEYLNFKLLLQVPTLESGLRRKWSHLAAGIATGLQLCSWFSFFGLSQVAATATDASKFTGQCFCFPMSVSSLLSPLKLPVLFLSLFFRLESVLHFPNSCFSYIHTKAASFNYFYYLNTF